MCIRDRERGDLFSGPNPYASMEEETEEGRGRVLDLVLPIAVLVVCCVIGMIYSGGFFSGAGFVEAFSNSDASVGLMLGSAFALVFTFAYYLLRLSLIHISRDFSGRSHGAEPVRGRLGGRTDRRPDPH